MNPIFEALKKWLSGSSSAHFETDRSPRPFERNRYKPGDLIEQLSRKQFQLVAGRWEVELDAPIGEIGIDLPDAHGSYSREAFAFLVEVLRHLVEMDNLVQTEACEKPFVQGQLGRENFELGIGWITVTEADLANETITITYYGLKVNTQWDGKFKRDADGQWRPLNF